MNPKLKALQDEMQANLKRIDDLLGRGNDMTDADFASASELNAKNDAIATQIRAFQAVVSGRDTSNTFLNGLPAPVGEAGPATGTPTVLHYQDAGKAQYNAATGQMVQEGRLGLISEKQWGTITQKSYKEVFYRYLKAGGLSNMNSMADIKLLQEGIDDQGGFLVPADILAELITKKPAPTSLLASVRKMDTTRDRVQIPKVPYAADNKYTTPIRVNWTGEVPASSTAHRATQPVFGLFEADIHTAMLSLPITNDMIEDSMIGVMEYIKTAFGQTVDLVAEDLILNGTGVKQPHGILENPGGANEPAVVASGSAATLTPDGLKNLQYGVPPQYQMDARWCMSWMNTAKVIEEMKDSQNRYLWGEGVQESGLSKSAYDRTLLSRPISYNEFSQVPGANTYPIVYGDFSAYYWIRRIGFSIQVLGELYAEVNQKVLLGRLRVGGDVAEDWKLNIQQCHT